MWGPPYYAGPEELGYYTYPDSDMDELAYRIRSRLIPIWDNLEVPLLPEEEEIVEATEF